MTPATHRATLAWVLVLLTFTLAGMATAQVGPSSKNIRRPAAPKAKKPAAKKPEVKRPAVRITPVRPRRAAATRPIVRVTELKPAPRPGVTRKPRPVRVVRPPVRITRPAARPVASAPAAPSPRQLAAQRWLADEIRRLQDATGAQASLVGPRLEAVRDPVEPPRPRDAEPEYTYRQKVTLQFIREDGAAFDPAQVRCAGARLEAQHAPGRLDLEGPAQRSGQAEVRLELPADWEFMTADDARVVLKDFPGQESRLQLQPEASGSSTAPRAAPAHPALTVDRKAPAGATRPPAAAQSSLYPAPAAALWNALSRLANARRLVDQSIPVAPAAEVDTRKGLWQNLDRAVRLAAEAEVFLQAAQDALARLGRDAEAGALVKTDTRYKLEQISDLVALGRLRRLQYVAEAEWWRAQCENPAKPVRETALKALVENRATLTASAEMSGQFARYAEVAQKEEALWRRIQAGEFQPRPAPRIQVTRHVAKTLRVRRTVLDLRIAQHALQPGDVVTLADARTPVSFRLLDGYWTTRISRAAVRPGTVLKLLRKTRASTLEADVLVQQADPYNPEGNEIARSPLRLVALHSFSVTGDSKQGVRLLEELESLDRDGAKLRSSRQRGLQEAVLSRDGSWWIAAEGAPVRYRLRPSPYPEPARPAGRAAAPPAAFSPTGKSRNEERNAKLTGRVIVDSIRLEAPSAGNVAGIQVGAEARAVEEALGGRVPADGAVTYLDGTLEIGTRKGLVQYLEIRRSLEELAGQAAPTAAPGTVTSIDYSASRIQVRTGAGFQPKEGTELQVVIGGRVLAADPSGGIYRAVVVSTTETEAICKLVRKVANQTAGDASWEVLRTLPVPETGAVILRLPGNTAAAGGS
jgi:hypothetical protein